MKHELTAALAGAALVAVVPAAQAAGHYVPGVEGVPAASVSPPGRYYLGYLVNYNLSEVSGATGHNTGTDSGLGDV